MTFKLVIQAQRTALQTQLDAIDTELQKKIDDETAKARASSKNLKFQIKRLDSMLETYKEYAEEFDKHEVLS